MSYLSVNMTIGVIHRNTFTHTGYSQNTNIIKHTMLHIEYRYLHFQQKSVKIEIAKKSTVKKYLGFNKLDLVKSCKNVAKQNKFQMA